MKASPVIWSTIHFRLLRLFPVSFLTIFWFESGRVELEKQAFIIKERVFGDPGTNLYDF